MTLYEIYMNYDKAIDQANELDQAATRLTNAAKKNMEQILSETHSAWRSDNSPRYIQKGQKVQNDMNVTADNLRRIADAIRSIALRVRNAELEAWRIAHARII